MAEFTVNKETFKVRYDKVKAKVKELIREGNIRRIIIKNSDGEKLIEIPLNLGVASVVLVPIWTAIGAIFALAADYTIEVEKIRKGKSEKDEEKIPSEAP